MLEVTLGNRIAKLRKLKGITQSDLAQLIGVSAPAVTNWEKDAYKPKAKSLQALANLFNVDIKYIIDGSDDPFLENPHQIFPDPSIQVPIISWEQAHSFKDYSSLDLTQVKGWMPISRLKADGLFFLKIQGIFNSPTFVEGDFTLVDSTCSLYESGDIVLVKNQDFAVIGLYMVETNGVKSLKTLNPDYHPSITILDESHTIIGLVIQSLRYTYTSKRR